MFSAPTIAHYTPTRKLSQNGPLLGALAVAGGIVLMTVNAMWPHAPAPTAAVQVDHTVDRVNVLEKEVHAAFRICMADRANPGCVHMGWTEDEFIKVLGEMESSPARHEVWFNAYLEKRLTEFLATYKHTGVVK